jgi:hypothetical protein
MKREPEKFGWTSPPAPSPKKIPDVPWQLADLVKTETDSAEPVDPVGAFVQEAEQPTKGASTATDFDICKAILADADFRDAAPVTTTLRKDVTIPDWSWSSPVSSDTPLEKRGTESARARFRRQLQKFFAGHPEEYEEAASVVSDCLATELAEIQAEA